MKPSATSKPFFSKDEVANAIAAAPEVAVLDLENPPTMDVDWEDAVVSRSLPELRETLAARRRGPNKRPTKEQVSVRYSADVLAAFRATGPGWQTRMDNALRDWLKDHSPA